MLSRLILFAFLGLGSAWAGQSSLCGPTAGIGAELEKIGPLALTDAAAYDQTIAPLQALRARYPEDLFVHERYQDFVQQYGIEGHLRQLTEEYQAFTFQHSGGLMYAYLFARSMIGRSTPSAIERLAEIAAKNPEFAPAHRELAEIYASERFRNPEKEKAEREKFLSSCPGSTLATLPPPLPGSSPLIARAEQMLAQNRDPDAANATALEGLRADEWRLQRIRPHDWYTVDYKRQTQRELQGEYWKVWGLQVRCYRKSRQPEKAAELLAQMEQRIAQLPKSDPNYSEAAATLARLRAEEGQKVQAPSAR